MSHYEYIVNQCMRNKAEDALNPFSPEFKYREECSKTALKSVFKRDDKELTDYEVTALLNWVGSECFISAMEDSDINETCSERLDVLVDLWNITEFFPFVTRKQAETALTNMYYHSGVKGDNDIYLFRLSESKPGNISLSYFDAKERKVNHRNYKSHEDYKEALPTIRKNIQTYSVAVREPIHSRLDGTPVSQKVYERPPKPKSTFRQFLSRKKD